jgi:hypothetical protein
MEKIMTDHIYEALNNIAQKVNEHTDTKTVRVDESFDHGFGTESFIYYELHPCGEDIELAEYIKRELKKILPDEEYNSKYTAEVYWSLSAEYRVGL